jgi:hypothetical protein
VTARGGAWTSLAGMARMPFGEQVTQRAVESAGSGLQEPMSPFLRPLHRLFLGKALGMLEIWRMNSGPKKNWVSQSDSLTRKPAEFGIIYPMGVPQFR